MFGRLPPGRWWRHVTLAGAIVGLLLAPGLDAPAAAPAVLAVAVPLLAVARRRGSPGSGVLSDLVMIALVAALAALAGLAAGDGSLRALEDGALEAGEGQVAHVEGFVASVPRTTSGRLRFAVETEDGRLVVAAPPHSGSAGAVGAQAAEIAVGTRIRARGRLASPEPFRADELARIGAALELRTRSIRVLSGGRGGTDGWLDRARTRAEHAISAGLEPEQAALARGFVLGQDDRIDEATRERFRRSGLAHLLAVSGQNVMLLAILAGVLLSLLGVGQRTRLALVITAIVVYVPLAGSGPSIQRAAVMGVAGIVAGLVGSARDRIYLPLLAAAATLLLNPLSARDIGWQLSFAAVLGISLWSAPLGTVIRDRLHGRLIPGRLASPLADGAALTIAATLATAPLMALHFEAFPLASLPANLLVLPAVAPVMWLGMLAAMLGQLPIPEAAIALLGRLQGPLLDYIDRVAELLAQPDGAVLELRAPPPARVALVYAGILAGMFALLTAVRRRRGLRVGGPLGATLALLAALALLLGDGRGVPPPPAPGSLRVAALDVGQGDAILLRGGDAPAILVDTGPPGAGIAETLGRHGIDRLAAVFITHDQLDHSGALGEILGAVRVERVLLARPAPAIAAEADAAGVPTRLIAAGARARFGKLRLDVLSPPVDTPPTIDPNGDSLVLAARFAGRRALLTGDAEAEAVPLQAGPLDTLKVAHHGSADAGLAALLDRSRPAVALVSVGADNPHGHPTAETLETLADHGICTLRTDLAGDAWVDLSRSGVSAGTERRLGEGQACDQ
jgi:competence protein ComEC